MTKRVFKWFFYALYFLGGSIIAFFLPEHARYLFGYLISVVAGWCWNVMNEPQQPIKPNEAN
jgi:hypothetical protein